MSPYAAVDGAVPTVGFVRLLTPKLGIQDPWRRKRKVQLHPCSFLPWRLIQSRRPRGTRETVRATQVRTSTDSKIDSGPWRYSKAGGRRCMAGKRVPFWYALFMSRQEPIPTSCSRSLPHNAGVEGSSPSLSITNQGLLNPSTVKIDRTVTVR
jgi:hypothetical protein